MRNSQSLFLLRGIKKGTAEMVEATTAPNPKATNRTGKTQQMRVEREVKSRKKLDKFRLKFFILYPLQWNNVQWIIQTNHQGVHGQVLLCLWEFYLHEILLNRLLPLCLT